MRRILTSAVLGIALSLPWVAATDAQGPPRTVPARNKVDAPRGGPLAGVPAAAQRPSQPGRPATAQPPAPAGKPAGTPQGKPSDVPRGKPAGPPPGKPDARSPAGNAGGAESGSLALSPVPRNPRLVARLQAMLPAGMTVTEAATGFKNQGLFVAAVHVAHNLGIPFVELKAKMVDEGLSLGEAIQALRPEVNAEREAARAQRAAERDLRRPGGGQ